MNNNKMRKDTSEKLSSFKDILNPILVDHTHLVNIK